MRYLALIFIILATHGLSGCQSTDLDEEGWVEAGFIPPPDAPKAPEPEESEESVAEVQPQAAEPAPRDVSSTESAEPFKAGLQVFKSDCKMKKDASDDSEKVGFIKKGKKLWVDKHDDNWGKVYRKSGHAFVPRHCF